MKSRTVVTCCLAGVVILFLGYGYGSAQSGFDPLAQPKTNAPASKIGVVSIGTAFRDCKANSSYRETELAEQRKIDLKIEARQKEIEAQEAGLKALKPGSSDHLKQYEELLRKQAELKAMNQFNGQQRALKDTLWTELLYKEFLQITKELARQKGLVLVLEVDKPTFPMPSADALMMALQSHKVLYSAGCVDLTAEVTAEMDKRESKLKL